MKGPIPAKMLIILFSFIFLIWNPYFRRISGLTEMGSIELAWNWLLKLGPPFDAVEIDLGGKNVEVWFHEFCKETLDWLSAHFASGS